MTNLENRTRAVIAGARPRVFGGVAVVLVLGIVLGEAAKHGVVPFDRSATEHLSKLTGSHPALRRAMEAVTFFGSSAWLTLVVVVTVLISILHRAVATAVRLLVCTAMGAVLTTLLKVIVDRQRPPMMSALVLATGHSFPSGHAMNSTVVYGALVLVFAATAAGRPRIVVWAATGALVGLIGFSRLALGVHYVSDVVGGVVLGGVWLLLIRPALGTYAGRPDD